MKAIEPILDAYEAGNQFLLVSGRSLHDLDVTGSGEIRPLSHALSVEGQKRFGMATLRFDLAMGAHWDFGSADETVQKKFHQSLRDTAPHFVAAVEESTDLARSPFDRAFRLLSSLHQSLTSSNSLPPLLIILNYAEDLARTEERGVPSDFEIQLAQVFQTLASEYHRRLHPILVLLCGVPEEMNPKVVSALHAVTLPLPDPEAKLQFIRKLKSLPALTGVRYENELDDRMMANLTARTPNAGLEQAFMASARTKSSVSVSVLSEQKRNDVIRLSDGTLQALDTERIRSLKLVGRTVERPLEMLHVWAEQLKAGVSGAPVGVILAGAPSTAKTDLALYAADRSGTPAYQLVSPKGPFVGHSERRARLQFRVFKDLAPAFGMIDEVTEAFPMDRNNMNLDSGASAAITAELLTALSDSSRSGRNLIVATTNCPWRVGAAMASRFIYVPVLAAVREDYPQIVCAIAERLDGNFQLSPEDDAAIGAAETFFIKGASPRMIRAILASKLSSSDGGIGTDLLIRAAEACAPISYRDRLSAEYADLSAIQVCSDLEFLPWYGRTENYPFPESLRDIVDPVDGSIDYERLSRRLEELKPNVNV